MLSQVKRHIVVLICFAVLCLNFTQVYAQGSNLEAINCAVTPDQILGQAYSRTSGAAGETDEGGLTPEGEDIVATGLAANVEWIAQNLLFATAGTEPVAILVVDDFSSDGTGDAPASHGWLVWEVFEQLQTFFPPEAGGIITFQQVNIADEGGYRSDLILPAIQSAIDEQRGQGISRFVLNLSFAFIPCEDSDTGFSFSEFVDARRRSAIRPDNPRRLTGRLHRRNWVCEHRDRSWKGQRIALRANRVSRNTAYSRGGETGITRSGLASITSLQQSQTSSRPVT
jgi:hypothetical protein